VPALKGIRLVKVAFSVAVGGLVLSTLRPFVPAFFSIVIPHLAVFSGLVLIHQATNDVLELKRRYLPFSLSVGFAALIGLMFFTSVHPNVAMRVYIVGATGALQTGLTAILLFRRRDAALRLPIRATGYLISGITVIHLLRIVHTVFYPPQADLQQFSSFQAFFVFFNFIFSVGAGFSLIWLSFCSQRNKLQALALTDGLTGLLNRRAFEETLQRELLYAQRCGMGTGLVLIDLDFFKDVNDVHGHAAGDEVLRCVSAMLQASTRGSDALGRFGGEEFIVMLRDSDPFHATMVAERMRYQVAALRGLPAAVHITASVGVAISSPIDTLESLLKKADDALYESKRSGRNRVTHYRDESEEMVPSLPELRPKREAIPTATR
jgi:diguanylate cyclase (GGDEF)-like protein